VNWHFLVRRALTNRRARVTARHYSSARIPEMRKVGLANPHRDNTPRWKANCSYFAHGGEIVQRLVLCRTRVANMVRENTYHRESRLISHNVNVSTPLTHPIDPIRRHER